MVCHRMMVADALAFRCRSQPHRPMFFSLFSIRRCMPLSVSMKSKNAKQRASDRDTCCIKNEEFFPCTIAAGFLAARCCQSTRIPSKHGWRSCWNQTAWCQPQHFSLIFFQPSTFFSFFFFSSSPASHLLYISCILYIIPSLQNEDIPPLDLADALPAGVVSTAPDSARPGPRNHHRQHSANSCAMGDQASRRRRGFRCRRSRDRG